MSTEPEKRLPPAAAEHFDIGLTDEAPHTLQRHFVQLGDVYRVYAPARNGHIWVLSNPDDARRVLVSNYRNYVKGVGLEDRVKMLLGNGIIVSEGDFWRKQRKLVQPAFHRRVLEKFALMIEAHNRQRLELWAQAAARAEPINVTAQMSELTLSVVLRSIFGRDLDLMSGADGDNPFALTLRDPVRNLSFAYRFRALTKQVRGAIERRRAHPDEENLDFLGVMMASTDDQGTPMGERELIDEVMTLIVAGHETTASVLNWIWYLLAVHPQIEAQLHAELDAARLSNLSLKSVETLTYTHQIIYEAMRLYPPVWVIPRRSIEADRIGNYELPPGTDLFISPYVIHRHPAHWSDAESFRPERFSGADEQARHRNAYLPFGAGARRCIGDTFAVYEMAVHLLHAARRFQLRLHPPGTESEPVQFEAAINLRTRRDVYMQITPRV